jgi:hypothetical protein
MHQVGVVAELLLSLVVVVMVKLQPTQTMQRQELQIQVVEVVRYGIQAHH